MSVVGASVPRAEAGAKVTGEARYAADLAPPGLLFARLVRSPYPRARLAGLDAGAALAVPGVVDLVSALDVRERLPGLLPWDPACNAIERGPDGGPGHGDAELFPPVARYVGEPMAMVLATSEGAAEEAVALLEPDWDVLPAAVTIDDALAEGAPLVHEGAPGNVASQMSRRLGDADTAFASAALVIERTFVTSRQKQAQLEPTACLCSYEGGRVTVWTPHQAPHRARSALAGAFGLPANAFRVIVPTVGGAFGKNDALTAEPYAVAGTLLARRPVRITYGRHEDFVGTESRHPTRTTMALAFRADGTIAAIRARSLVDAGAYLSHSAAITAVLLTHMLATYRIEHADLEATCVYTDTPVCGAFRGYGGPQACLPLEHLIDLGCRELGVDPLGARRRMGRGPGDPAGYRAEPISGDGFRLCLDRGAAAIGWERRAGPSTSTAASSTARRRGLGMAATIWKSGIVGKGLDHSAASVRLAPDGSVLLLTAASDLGTGIGTTLAQICADALGVPLAAVVVAENDTDATPFDSGAFASRTLFRAGQAVEAAARRVRADLLAWAASHLEIGPDDLELHDGLIQPVGSPDRGLPLTTLLREALTEGHEFAALADAPQTTAPAFCAAFAEVEVDVETGVVDVRRLVVAEDVGRAINPAIVSGQIRGAAHQGLGYALSEGLVVDPQSGVVQNGTYMDYRLLTSADTPPIEVVLVEEPDPAGPFGARGAGEPGIVVVAPAVANAILDALGTAPTELPFTPERVLAALDAAGAPPS